MSVFMDPEGTTFQDYLTQRISAAISNGEEVEDNAENRNLIAALRICGIVHSKGGVALFVGGCIRDFLFDHSPKDFDIEVYGLDPNVLTDLLAKYFDIDVVGVSFGVIKIKGFDIDVSVPRRDSIRSNGGSEKSHTNFEVSCDPNMSIAEAALRRDFAINALAYDPFTRTLHASYEMLDDVKYRVLSPTSEHFSEDPLRVFRAAQFIARFRMHYPDSLVDLCKSIPLTGLSKERVFEEIKKLLLKGVDIGGGFDFLVQVGVISRNSWPELYNLIGCPQHRLHHKEADVWDHTMRCLDYWQKHLRTGNDKEDLIVALAILCHDMGKPDTTHFIDGEWRARGHACAGVPVARRFLERLTNETSLIEDVCVLVDNHLAFTGVFGSMQKQTEEGAKRTAQNIVRRLSLMLPIHRLLKVSIADCGGRIADESVIGQDFHYLFKQVATDMDAMEKPVASLITGKDIIELGVAQGPIIGDVLRHVLDLQVDGFITTKERAILEARDFLCSKAYL